MNIIVIMSGGVGNRFGGDTPKQYCNLAGRPVIDYVLDAAEQSEEADKIVIVMDSQWIDVSPKLKNRNYDFAPNGGTRIESMYNGLKAINDKYVCEKVVILDAVAPFVYPELIDDYFQKLDIYDAVITAQKITGGFTDIYDSRLDREKYIITQSPEGFRFPLLWKHYDLQFPFQETAGMLPDGSKRYYNFNFKNNMKLTYGFELKVFEQIMNMNE